MATLLSSSGADQLSTRPNADDWSPVEVLCHLRDVEELSLLRFRMMIQMDEPLVPAATPPADKERWGLLEEGAALFDQERLAEQRQYSRNDPQLALAAFADNRQRSLGFLAALSDAQWVRGAIHPAYGRVDFDDLTSILAWHDQNHISQLTAGL